MPVELRFFFAFVVVLALIGVAAWLIRRFSSQRVGAGAARGRMPRLAVIDAAPVDNRRRLVLVRRDNVEHLLMIGGPSDIVVEPNISRAGATGREAAIPRAPATDNSWMESEPTELPPPPESPRMPRPPIAVDEPRRPAPPPIPERRPEPRHEPRPEPMAAFAPEPMPRATPRAVKPPMPRPPMAPPVAPPVTAPAAAAADTASQADQNLAEMAQRLEAALRRPGAAEPPRTSGPTVAVNPVDRIGAPPVAPETAPARPASDEPEATEPERKETGFESLEAEMANLLGRPKNPS